MGYKPLIWLLLLTLPCWAQTTFDPLTIGIGARALGMGGAAVAVAEDADAIMNNPAGLGEIDHQKFTSMAGTILEDVNYTILGGVFPLGEQSAIGFGYAGAFVSGIELYDNSGTYTRKANYGRSVGLLSYGKKLSEDFSLGATLKYYMADGTENDGSDGNGWNVDIGLLQSGLEWLSLGATAQNVLSSSNFNYKNGEKEELPATIKLGGKLAICGSKFRSAFLAPYELNAAFDGHYDLRGNRPMTTHWGVEFSPNPILTLRSGFDENNLTAGLTLKIAGLGFTYAYHPYGGFADNVTNYFSITYDERGWEPEAPPNTFLGCK